MSGVPFDPFAGGELERTAPSTEPQREIWLAVELGGENANLAYNESTSLRLHGPLDPALLEQALQVVVSRHEALRTTLSLDGSTLCVESAPRLTLERLSLRGRPEQDRLALTDAGVREPFHLASGPLLRAQLLELADQEWELVLVAHHVVCDGWSFGVLLSELATVYTALAAGTEPGLDPAPRFTDYAALREQLAVGAEATATERFWLERLGREPAVLDLPTDHPRPLERTFGAARLDRALAPELVAQLRATARSLSVSLVALLFAAHDALLFKLTGQTDFVVGLPAAGQSDEGWNGLVGHCVNTLPVRTSFDPNAPFADHARSMRSVLLDAVEHQHASFGTVLAKLELPRDPSRVPLVPVLFNVDPRVGPFKLGAATGELHGNPRAFEAFELFLNCAESSDGLVLELTFNTALFEPATIEHWLDALTAILAHAASEPTTALGRLRCLTDAAQLELFETRNATERPLPEPATVTAAIACQVAATPHALAVRDSAHAYTYAELDAEAIELARALAVLGVERGQLVGVCVERSARMVCALLAIWKLGAAYVPLDPEYPAGRLEFIALDTQLRVLVTERAVAPRFDVAGLRVLFLDDLDTAPAAPAVTLPEGAGSDVAYVLHTSGSTGTPKGVVIEQGALLNFLCSMAREPGLGASDVLVAVTTLSFDIAGLELYLPLTVGAQVVVASRETAMDGQRLLELLGSSDATLLQATPATYRLLLDAGLATLPAARSLKALVGGEALPEELATELTAQVRELWNMYGPTETTVWSTCARVVPGEPITLGRPIDNTRLYVLDALGEPVPLGAFGELYIGGGGLARGYLRREELTAERFPFVPLPGGHFERLYRTGDLVRYDHAGRLHFCRRIDAQVKLRGFRIELGEVEGTLERHPSVASAVAVLRRFGDADTRLVAYYVEKAPLETAALRSFAVDQLPHYMVPQHLVPLAELPLTPNGKVDRRALPDPSGLGGAAETTLVEPTTPVQRQLAAIWRELLRVQRVGIKESFFEIGGHSMLAARMLARVRDLLGVELPLRTVFQRQSIEQLAERVEATLLLRNEASARAASDEPRETFEF